MYNIHMDRKELFNTMPWHVQAQWWALTILAVIYILPITILVILNPLWFRQAGMDWAIDHANYVSMIRDRIMMSQIQKYRIFDILKEID